MIWTSMSVVMLCAGVAGLAFTLGYLVGQRANGPA
jgi:hypothetical protein